MVSIATLRLRFLAMCSVLFAASAHASLLIDPSGGTTLWNDSATADDAVISQRELGFELTFFGDYTSTTIDVSTNGNLNFTGDVEYANDREFTDPVARISPLWDDFVVVAGSGDSIVESVIPGFVYAVTWKVHGPGASASRFVFQVAIFGAAGRLHGVDFQAGDIVFSYQQVGVMFAKGNASVGLESAEGDFALLPDAENIILPSALAELLPLSAGDFVLFRPDADGGAEYLTTINVNHAPIAADDLEYMLDRKPLDLRVLENDSDPDGDSLTIAAATQGIFGNVEIRPNGILRYTAGAQFAGADSFTYTVKDRGGFTASARVNVLRFSVGKGAFEGMILLAPDPDDPEAPPLNEASGLLTLTLGGRGTFTGKLRYGGFTQAIRGAFDAHGNFNASFERLVFGEPETVEISLHLDLTGDVDQITGTVSDGSNSSVVSAGRGRFAARTFPAPHAGVFTMLLGAVDGGFGPAGIGFARMRVDSAGKVALAGKLGDGTPFSAGTQVKVDHTFPLYVPYHVHRNTRAGSIFGTLKFDDLTTSDLTGSLHWFSAEDDEEWIDTEVALSGSRYVAPPRGVRVLDYILSTKNAMISVGEELAETATLRADNRLLIDSANEAQISVRLDPARGLFRGGFSEPSDEDPDVYVRRNFTGALLQKPAIAGGFFLSPNGPGPVIISAPVAAEPEG